VFRWLNFVLVFGGGGYLLARKAPAVFRARAEAIASRIAEANRLREEAERRLHEAGEKLRNLEQEVAQLRAAARQDAAAEAERIRALARDEAQKIAGAAQFEVEATERAARIELRAAAARLAVERAEALLRRQMTAQAEAGLFQNFVAGLARSVH
jgi:F-type H+-transporting ATPase subunit b